MRCFVCILCVLLTGCHSQWKIDNSVFKRSPPEICIIIVDSNHAELLQDAVKVCEQQNMKGKRK